MSIPQESVLAVQNFTGYQFQNTDYLWLALQTAESGVSQIGNLMVGYDGNERLAIVGDAVINLVTIRLSFWETNFLSGGK